VEWSFLSYPWGPSSPAYGGGARAEIRQLRSIAAGDTSNSIEISGSNHIGTHIDFPRHFCRTGHDVLGYRPEDFLFPRVVLFWFDDLGRKLISPELLASARVAGNLATADICLVRTGASRYRDAPAYWSDGPGLAPGLGDWLRAQSPSVRAIGVDAISASAFWDRDSGRKIHRELLCHDARPLLIIEDMNLEPLSKKAPQELVALPLRIEGGDGAPCTIIARLTRE